jgi:Ca2+-binding EF-hand superfamily protein
MFDKDNDGIITPNELRQALKDMGKCFTYKE